MALYRLLLRPILKMNKANEKQDEAAFVTVYGALNTGSSGKAASDASFRYCYSSSMVNGARSVCYSDTLKNYFRGKYSGNIQESISLR